MNTKNVLGLDIGTNSIGWALIKLPSDYRDFGKSGSIELLGSRILPDSDYKKAFEIGKTNSPSVHTPAAVRRQKRGSRRLKHRYKLRRSRLIKFFKTLDWLRDELPLDNPKKIKALLSEGEKIDFHISNEVPFSNQTYCEFYKNFGYSDKDIDEVITEIYHRKNYGKKLNTEIKLLPEDWVVYFLRKKALTEKIETSELVRIIYMLNQRRGFKSSRKDLKNTNILPYDVFMKRKEDKEYGENGIETKFVCITKIKSIVSGEEKRDNKGNLKGIEYEITAEDSRMHPWKEVRKKRPEWDLKGEAFTFLVTLKVDKNGKLTPLKPQIPSENDWSLCTTALDEKIEQYEYPGQYFFEELVKAHIENRTYKIRQFPVHRWRYEKELTTIWKTQCLLNPELQSLNSNRDILYKLAKSLYPTQTANNLGKLREYLDNDLLHILIKDIIYYQRELKSQKNSISECRYEKRIGKEKNDTGEFITTGIYGLKCIPKSSPLFQEFRIWQDIHNIKIFKREENYDGKTMLDVDCTSKYLTPEIKLRIYTLFNSKTSISENDILATIKQFNLNDDIIISEKKDIPNSHRINLFANRESIKGNEIKARYKSIFHKTEYNAENILSDENMLYKLWHIDYSITSSDEEKSKKGITNALNKLLPDLPNKEKVIDHFLKLSELPKEYGAYSSMAIKKLLPLMRVGDLWNVDKINDLTKKRIHKIINGELDETIKDETRDNLKKWEKQNRILNDITDFNGLPTWLAGYVVYGIHSEIEIKKCQTAEEFNTNIVLQLKNNSLRNPVVEQVIRETLLLVRDIWKALESKKERIDEIHIELGRELKNSTEEKQKIAESQANNFTEKQRIKELLKELLNDGFTQYNYEEEQEQAKFEAPPNPNNPSDIEKFRVWRSLSKYSDDEWNKLVKEQKIPSEQEIKKYILWLCQNCRSPYTGKIIPLSKLFNENEYQKEHIIPRSKLKNDSMNNLVIVEAAINPKPYKGDMLARNFIAQFGGKNGKEYEIHGRKYSILGEEAYEKMVNETFKHNKAKRKNLLATEVPDNFILRQLNDMRFITRKVSHLLKPVVDKDSNIIFTGGSITSELKQSWGLHKEWKKLLLPRFERLEKITGNKYYTINEKDQNNINIHVPENEKIELKRLDHRHHALDALIIAATTREHIRYLNSLNAADTNEDIKLIKRSLVKLKIRDFNLPWNTFTKDVINKLQEVIVSFKLNNRLISKPKNFYTTWSKNSEPLRKEKKEQKPHPNWIAIRKSLFKEPLGVIWLKKIKDINVKDAFEIEIDNQLAKLNGERLNTHPYIYDKTARQIIKQLISQCNSSIDEKESLIKEIDTYLKKNKIRKNCFLLNGNEYEKIAVAEFVSYKTKRMSLTKKEYVESLSIEKMKKDFPYFDSISETQFQNFDSEKQEIIIKAGMSINKIKQMNAFNLLFLEHILEYKNIPKDAFCEEGIDILNKKAKKNTAIGKEIKTITRLDGIVDRDDMFKGGFYETDKGAMMYFVFYENNLTKERSGFDSISAHKAIEKLINKEPVTKDKPGFKIILLSPGDLVYVPTTEEQQKLREGIALKDILNSTDKKNIENRIYKVVSFSGEDIFFVQAHIAKPIIPTDIKNRTMGEIYWHNKSPKTMDDEVIIKDVCVKFNIDRIGKIRLL